MTNKVSQYNIEIESSKNMLLYNTLTDKIFNASYKDYTVIETLLENLPVFEKMYPDLFRAFKVAGFIIDSDIDELAIIKLQNKKRIFLDRNYHLTINPTLDCNLKCWYCSVDYAGTKHNQGRMNEETINSLCKHTEQLILRNEVKSILLDWFGGEPMMYYDEVVSKVGKFTKKIASENNVVFKQQITTNATLLTKERIQEMKELNFRFFQISIDGCEKKHNKIKQYSNKKGTYLDVVNNINLLTKIIPDIRITLRINYDKQTLKNAIEIIKDLTKQSKKCINVDFQKIWQVPSDNALRKLLLDTKEEFKTAGLVSGFWAYKPGNYRRCYADSFNHYVINFDGKVYKCTARDYSDRLIIGNLQTTGHIKWNDGILSKMFDKAAFENEKCESCKLLPACMGPCIQKGYDVRTGHGKFQCLIENVEYSVSNYVTNIAKQRKLI